MTVDSPIDTAPEIVAVARPLLRALDVSVGVRLLGVSASNLAEPNQQLSLLDDTESPHRAAGAIDEIRAKFGVGGDRPGELGRHDQACVWCAKAPSSGAPTRARRPEFDTT